MKKYNSETSRKSGVSTIKDAINALLEVYQLRDKMDEHQIDRVWKELMGENIARQTTEIYVKSRTLYIKLASASLKSELTMSKTKIMDHLNQKLGNNLIDKVILS